MKTIKLLSILLVAMACVSAVNCEEEGSYYDDDAPKVDDYAKNADVSADRSLAGEEYDDDAKGEETKADEYETEPDEYLTEDNGEQTELNEDETEADEYETEADGEETGKDTAKGITADLSNGEQDETKRGVRCKWYRHGTWYCKRCRSCRHRCKAKICIHRRRCVRVRCGLRVCTRCYARRYRCKSCGYVCSYRNIGCRRIRG